MASTKEYLHYILEQLSGLDDVRYRAMMGEYILYYRGKVVGGVYDTEEGCLSLIGTRKAKRYRSIKVRWQNEAMQMRLKTFTGWTAQIIQHEIVHCNGILI